MRKLITEFLGTFFLVLVIGMVVTTGKGDFAPIAIGSVLMVMIFAGAHVSGAHYNPAVTLAIIMRGRITLREGIPYIVVQIIGAIIAAALVNYLMPDKVLNADNSLTSAFKGLVAETLGTFALAYVVLNVATAKGTSGNMFYGLSIGFTVLSMAYAFGTVSSCAFNPAVALGISVNNLIAWSDIWVYMLGCFGGAAIAALVFRINNPEDK